MDSDCEYDVEYLDDDWQIVTEAIGMVEHGTKKSSDVWDEFYTCMLLDLYDKHKDSNRKMIWMTIASHLNKEGMNINANQAKSKFHNLFAKYKEARDHNNQSGSDRRTSPFYDVFEDICTKQHNINPTYSCSSIALGQKTRRSQNVKEEIDDAVCEPPLKKNKIEEDSNEENEHNHSTGQIRRKRNRKSEKEDIVTYIKESTDSLANILMNSTNTFVKALENMTNIMSDKKNTNSKK